METIMAKLSSREILNEEINFFRDICGFSDERIEVRLGLKEGTLDRRRFRAAAAAREEEARAIAAYEADYPEAA